MEGFPVLSRRVLVNALLVAAVVVSTGCCGRIRNCVYRMRHCPSCAVGFDGPVQAAPVAASPVGGCSTCYSGGGAPMDIPVHATPVGYPPVVSGPVFTGPIPGIPAPTVTPQSPVPAPMPGEKK
jgi:hypothetical protein